MSPRRGLRACSTPGCGHLVTAGRCQDCSRRAARSRGSATRRGYDRRWRRTRQAYLRAHPYCECAECAQVPAILRPRAEDVHHRDGLGPSGPRGLDWSNLQALTHAHHSRETAEEQPGGWHDQH